MEEREARDAQGEDTAEEGDSVRRSELREGYQEGYLQSDGSVDGCEA